MSETAEQYDFSKLSIAERIILVQDIWDSIANDKESIEMTSSQKAELERRLREHEKDPHDVVSWDDVRNCF